MKKIMFLLLGIIICLNLLLTIGSNANFNNISLKLLNANASWWPENNPPGQIEDEVGCQIWVYGCWYCGGGGGWCTVSGTMIDCVDQYVCPSCTCTPGECTPEYNC